MTNFTNPLNNIKIASPCSQDWDAMIGVGRKRFCTECKLNVYNLSGMTRREAESLLLNSEGRLCVRYYKRADGTVLTEDCPVGWQAVKKRVSRMAAAAFSLVVGLIGGLGFTTVLSQTNTGKKTRSLPVLTTPTPEILMGDVAIETTPTPKPTPEEMPEPLMGAIAVPTPSPKATPKATPKDKSRVLMGKVAPLNKEKEVLMGEAAID